MWFQTFKAVNPIQVTVFWDVMPCCLVDRYQHSGGCKFHLNVAAAYQTTRHRLYSGGVRFESLRDTDYFS
jgi:hypothetical protein